MSTNHLLVLLALAVLAFVVLRLILFRAPRVSALDADAAIKAGTAVLADVREPGEWSGGVAAPAALLPMSDFRGDRELWSEFLDANREKQIIVYCASGMRSGVVARSLNKQGFRAANLGGFGAWAGAGLPVRKP